MEWLNIHASTIDAEEFLGAEPLERATWLCLMRYCAGQENAGTIQNCADWTDRKWQQLCRVTLAEVKTPSQLWRWKGPSVVIWKYPLDQERNCQRLRKQAKEAAEKRWESHHPTPNGTKPPRVRAGTPKNGLKKRDRAPLLTPEEEANGIAP